MEATVIQEGLSQVLGLGVAEGQLSVPQIVARGIVVYVAGVALVRVASKRFMGRHTPFDLILAVILGSMLARAINGEAPLWGTLAVGLMLVLADRVLALATSRSERFRRWLEGRPTQLVREGSLLRDAMRQNRITEEHLMAAIRGSGYSDTASVAEAYIEASGTISVVPRDHERSSSGA